MNEQTVIDIGLKSVVVTMKVAAPALIATLVVGILVSIFQAATQINEQTLSFIPKMVGMTAAMVIFGPWIIHLMMTFTIDIFNSIPNFTQ